jgi:hypothetical protein
VDAEGAGIVQATPGQVLYSDVGVVIEVLAPPERLPADASSDPNRAMDAPMQSNVLKVAHHGSRTSTSQRFLERVGPAVAVSLGRGGQSARPPPRRDIP